MELLLSRLSSELLVDSGEEDRLLVVWLQIMVV